MNKTPQTQLLITDIDNTVFDWVGYYVPAFEALLDYVADKIGTHSDTLKTEAKEVFTREGSIEYPFLVQELESVNKYYGNNTDKMITEVVEPGRKIFNEQAAPYLKPYEGVKDTFEKLRNTHTKMPIVALTDAPRYIAMWKLNKLGLLDFFDAVYGLADPRIPVCVATEQIKVESKILFKHLLRYDFDFEGKIRILPDEYEKPGTKGMKAIFIDYQLDETPEDRTHVIWVGDNLRKDIGLGNKLGIQSVWAEYGAQVDKSLIESLAKFSPEANIHKNVALDIEHNETPVPNFRIKNFAELGELI